MKNLIMLVIILFLGTVFAQEKSGDDKKENKTQQNQIIANENKAELNTICPVSKEEADPEITYEYKGKTYALCCNNCLKKFKKDPEKYISKLNEDGESNTKKTE